MVKNQIVKPAVEICISSNKKIIFPDRPGTEKGLKKDPISTMAERV
jgi:hypothetical protein